MIRLLMSLTLLVTFCTQAGAAITLEELQQRSSRHANIRAEFEQSRHISGLGQPLLSSGKVIISQQHGLWWNQLKPFPLTLLLTEQKMVQSVPNQPPQVITAASNPQMFQFNHLLTALFHADKATLEKNFTLELSSLPDNRWQLILQPKTTPLDKLFRKITLTGADFLQTIDIDDMQNDKSSIRFFNHKTTPQRLTDEESRLFAS
jgi:outer membrane lipoprotein-sorting protein